MRRWARRSSASAAPSQERYLGSDGIVRTVSLLNHFLARADAPDRTSPETANFPQISPCANPDRGVGARFELIGAKALWLFLIGSR